MMDTDRELTKADIQSLSTRDNVVSFFAALGYRTDARLPQTCAAMGITAETLQRQITHIERIALQEHGAEPLDVYLIELTSVTVAATQGLARALRNRAGNYFLVLTDDYERLDFVLLERSLPVSLATPITPRQVTVRPRILTVNRRVPSPVQLRVLRRFTYTEADSDAQYEKLLSAYEIAEWAEPLFNNRALFSDYYLTNRLREREEWRRSSEALYHRLKKLVTNARQRLSGQGQKTTWVSLLQPAFEAMGFRTVVSADQDGAQTHYGLHSSNGSTSLVALCLAYTWNRNLDGRDETRDSDAPDENPGARVVTLLESGEAPWAMVTNGKVWRLYSAKAHSRATNYYEMDLDETLAADDPNVAFRYFSLFFAVDSFIPRDIVRDGQSRKLSFLDELLEESEDYAKSLGERLKDRVFEEIFPHLAEGFVEYLRSRPPVTGAQQGALLPVSQQLALKQEPDEAFRRQVFQGTLTLLYRLLFLLYAESRGLLPVKEERGYWEHSLTRLKEEVATRAGSIADEVLQKLRSAYRADSASLYDRLSDLFRHIDQGKHEMNLPHYNGGLFVTSPDPNDRSPETENARFLLGNKIPDRYLALGIDLLARDIDDKRHDLVFIDYKSLGVRQLGSIYEGLLEFRVRIAQEKMAVVQGKKTEEIIPYSEAIKTKRKILAKGRGRNAEERTYPPGKVYLENDRRERKATGSYYTPDHIVKYIVEHTVGPVLEGMFDKMRPTFREAQQAYRNAQKRAEGFRRQGMKPDDPSKVARTYREKGLVDDLFDLRVLDPAMGSGHFLVEAVDFICDRILGQRDGFLQAFPWNPVTEFLKETREAILAEMERQGVTIDAGRLTDINLLKRHILKRCVYGVDLNPMAVELAKVSLWLDCFTLGAPLSFLDHHLKCGNSLIGTKVQEVEAELAAGKKGHYGDLFGGPFQGMLAGTNMMLELARTPDVTVEEAEHSKKLFAEFEAQMRPYKAALDIWVSRHFGNQRAQEFLTLTAGNLVEHIRSGGVKLSLQYREAISKAAELSREKRFFHWDLEFPEAFVDLERQTWKENGGFDAVVGNPPYLILGNYEQYEQFFEPSYTTVGYKTDYYMLFVEQGLRLISDTGWFSQVFPNKFAQTKSGQGLRELLARYEISSILDFGTNQVFDNVVNYVLIPVIRRGRTTRNRRLHYSLKKAEGIETIAEFEVSSESLAVDGWRFVDVREQSVIEKMRERSLDLSAIALDMFAGIQTGADDLLVVSSATIDVDNLERSLLRRFLKGRHIRRFEMAWDDGWLVHPYDDQRNIYEEATLAKRFPNVWKYLCKHKERLSNRVWFGKSPVDTSGKWYGLMYLPKPEVFAETKILCPYLAQQASFTIDSEGALFGVGAGYGIFLREDVGLSPFYVLALLNSSISAYRFAQISPRFQAGYKHNEVYISQLPIRHISFITPPDQRKTLAERGRKICEADLSLVITFVEQRLSAEPEESDVVHDLLAFLAEQMIDLNKQKQAEQKRFLNWLGGTLKISPDGKGNAGLDALTGKSKLRNYLGDYQKDEPELSPEEMEGILHKNRSKLGVNPPDGRLQASLRAEYQKSLTVLRPIKDRLASTDRLIDQIVYKLYGLTDEEITMVETRGTLGKGSEPADAS